MSRFLIALLLTLALVTPTSASSIPTLSSENFQKYKEITPQLFVLFHRNDCPYCEYLTKTFLEVLEELRPKYPNLEFAFLNMDKNPAIQESEEVQESPVVKFFVDGYLFNYFWFKLTKAHITNFIESTLGHSLKPSEIKSDRTFVKFNNLDFAIGLGFPSVDEKERQLAQNLQTLFPEIPIFYLTSGSRFDKLIFPNEDSSKGYRLIFKRQFDEGDKSFASKDLFEANDIIQTIWRLKNPRVKQLDQNSSDDIFSGQHSALILFDSDLNSERVTLLSQTLLEKSFDGLHLKSDGTESSAETIMNHLGITKDDFPVLRVIKITGGKIIKYRLDGEIEKDNLLEFLDRLKNDKIEVHLKNAAVVSNKGKHVLKINRNQYYKQVADAEVILVVGMIAKWCPNCAGINQLLEETRKEIRDKKSFVFATIDLDLNDVDGVDVGSVPLIRISRNGQVSNYQGQRTKKALADYLNAMITEEL